MPHKMSVPGPQVERAALEAHLGISAIVRFEDQAVQRGLALQKDGKHHNADNRPIPFVQASRDGAYDRSLNGAPLALLQSILLMQGNGTGSSPPPPPPCHGCQWSLVA